MTIEMDKIFVRAPALGSNSSKKREVSKKQGLNRWIPDNLERFNYIITNPSKVQSYSVGIENGPMRTLHPGKILKFNGDFENNFEFWTGKLIAKGLIHISIEDLSKKKAEPKLVKEEPDKPRSGNACGCGRRLSPRNKNGVCLYCRKNKQ